MPVHTGILLTHFPEDSGLPESRKDTIDQLYSLIANEEDERVCKDIPEEACREVPRNFFLILASNVLTKLGDLLISPKTVLAWLMSAIGAPALVAWLVPIRESGSLVPQMVIAAWVRRKPVRKWFWTLGSFGQAASVVAMAASIWFFEGYVAGSGIIAALIVFSLARGFCSVSMKDVQGKCIPKTRRGRLGGLASTIGGTATVVLTALLFWERGDPTIAFYTVLLLLAGVLWVIAGFLFAGVEEYEGETGGGGNAITEAFQSLSLLRDDAPFRHFVITRALLLCSALASPYFVVLAQKESDIGWMLGIFLLASSLASSLSASFWGWAADTSSRRVMIRGAAMASGVCLLVGFSSEHSPRRRQAGAQNLSGGYGRRQQTHRLHGGEQHGHWCSSAGYRRPDRPRIDDLRGSSDYCSGSDGAGRDVQRNPPEGSHRRLIKGALLRRVPCHRSEPERL